MIDLKTLDLHLESKLHSQQNKDTQILGPNSIDMTRITRQLTDSADQKRQRKENKETRKERNKQKTYPCESNNSEMKYCHPGENIFIIDRAKMQINKGKLKYRLEEYGK